MESNLQNWINNHKLLAFESEKGSNVIVIEGLGKFLHVEHKEGKIIDEDFSFILYDEELDMIEDKLVDFILFEFGKRFYYSKIVEGTNKYNETIYKPEFNDFLYLGESSENDIDIDFVHLGVHDEYEILNGSGNAGVWCKKAKFLKQKAIGTCNKDTLAGSLAFQSYCDKYGIKPILGETISVATEYDESASNQVIFELKLFVLNEIGWRNLLAINRNINVEFDKFIPIDILYEHGEGLCCVIPKNSEINFKKDDVSECKKLVKKLKKSFDSVYYQIDTVIYTSDSKLKEHLSNLDAYLTNLANVLEPITINDSYYLESEDNPIKEMLNSVSGKASDGNSKNQYFKDVLQTLESYSEWLEQVEPLYNAIMIGIENTVVLSDSSNFKINTGTRKLPKFEVEDVESKFYSELERGITKRLSHLDDEQMEFYLKRVETECNVIVPNGLCDYFMILWDITNWCHKNKILVGSGRGSVCGSLIAYLLRITDVDPIEHDLLFERFLNETRVSGERAKSADSMPDIDIDFPAGGRDLVKEYIREKYGYSYTCSIGTYGRMKLKTCIKDFAKIKGLTFDYTNKLTDEIEDRQEYTWGDFIEFACASKILYKFTQEHSDIVMLTKYALMQCKSESVHASAVVIVPKFDEDGNEIDVFNWMPMKKINGMLVSEWEGKYIDKSGFLKEDILGLSQLDKFDDIMKLIKKHTGKKINLTKIPLDDEETYKLFRLGHCEDVFQFGTTGLMNYCRQVKPENLEHLIAMTAIYRPGPMSSRAHEDFANIKNGKKKPVYDFGLQEVTQDTYGLYVYQEQIMKAVNVLGGLTLVEADQLRTYMKKKDKKAMSALSEKFIAGAEEKGCSKKEAEKIWEKLDKFSGYGFNKSHAAAYSLMSYWSQWFKVNYPLEFWTVCLQHSEEKEMPFRLSEMRKINDELEIRPPDVNYSDINFTCDEKNSRIFFSLTKIKGCGEVATRNIIETRQKVGSFFDFDDFVKNVPSKVNKSVICALILAGAFDLVCDINKPKDRKNLLEKYLKDYRKESLPDKYLVPEASNNSFWVEIQRDLTGYGNINYLSLIKKKVNNMRYSVLYTEGCDIPKVKDNTEVVVAGKILWIKVQQTKNGEMAYITLENNNDNILVQFWPEEWSNKETSVKIMDFKNKVIAINGVVKYSSFKGCKVVYVNSKTKFYLL